MRGYDRRSIARVAQNPGLPVHVRFWPRRNGPHLRERIHNEHAYLLPVANISSQELYGMQNACRTCGARHNYSLSSGVERVAQRPGGTGVGGTSVLVTRFTNAHVITLDGSGSGRSPNDGRMTTCPGRCPVRPTANVDDELASMRCQKGGRYSTFHPGLLGTAVLHEATVPTAWGPLRSPLRPPRSASRSPSQAGRSRLGAPRLPRVQGATSQTVRRLPRATLPSRGDQVSTPSSIGRGLRHRVATRFLICVALSGSGTIC